MVFFINDSSIVEGVVDIGNTPSRALFEHILRIKRVQFRFKFVLHIIHCSRTRMPFQGTDGVSRENLNQGLLSGNHLRACMKLNLSACERFPGIKLWLNK